MPIAQSKPTYDICNIKQQQINKMKHTLKVTRVIYEVSIVEVELTAKQLKSMSKFDLDVLAGDLETDRDVHYTGQDVLNVEVLDGHGHTIQF